VVIVHIQYMIAANNRMCNGTRAHSDGKRMHLLLVEGQGAIVDLLLQALPLGVGTESSHILFACKTTVRGDLMSDAWFSVMRSQ
jgi:hypothetical protein